MQPGPQLSSNAYGPNWVNAATSGRKRQVQGYSGMVFKWCGVHSGTESCYITKQLSMMSITQLGYLRWYSWKVLNIARKRGAYHWQSTSSVSISLTVMAITISSNQMELYLFSINAKTGYLQGNGKGHSGCSGLLMLDRITPFLGKWQKRGDAEIIIH